MLLPYLFYSFYVVIVAFALLGIGNTILQVSLNPLVSSIANQDKLASTLTFGQFIKAISSFLGPIIASIMVKQFGDWELTFLIFAAVSLLSLLCLGATQIEEDNPNNENTSFSNPIKLLKDNVILKLFLGMLLIVGIDVGKFR